MDNNKRSQKHKKNELLESIFPELERYFGEIENEILINYESPEKPVFFIVGCARSGSTFLHQLLAATELFCYPTNLMSRFYYAPYWGAKIQQLLVEADLKGEILGECNSSKLFVSDLGKTKGPLQPHEFWYFWNRFFRFHEVQLLKEELTQETISIFLKELSAIQAVYSKPLAMKAGNMNWHIPYLASLSPNFFFINIQRDIKFNAQSLYNSRLDFFGTAEEWYSFKPPSYPELKKLSSVDQVFFQVRENQQAIEEGFNELPKQKIYDLKYETLCDSPYEVITCMLNHFQLNFDSLLLKTVVEKMERKEINKINVHRQIWDRWIFLEEHNYKK